MKERKLAPIIAISISFHLIVSPVMVHAQAQQAIGTVLGVASQVMGVANPQGQQQGVNSFTAASVQALNAQLTPIPQDKLFNPQLGQIPGLAEFFAKNNKSFTCSTLQSTLSEVQSDACKEIDTRGNIGAQIEEAKAFELKYKEISKMYGSNFKVKSNAGGQLFGVGCMNDAKKTLHQFFNHRLNELTLLTNEIDKLNQNFKEGSKQDLERVEDAVAVLDGGELAKKVGARNKELLNFAKNFENPACNSMQSKDKFDNMGLDGGLNAINKDLKNKYTDDRSGYSAESYRNVHAGVVADINSIADKVSTQVKLNSSSLAGGGYRGFLDGLQSLGSQYGVSKSLTADLFSDVQLDFNAKDAKLRKDFANLSGGVPILANIDFRADDAQIFENQVTNFEKRENNSCLGRDLNIDDFKKRLVNSKVSTNSIANNSNSPVIKDIEEVVRGDYSFEEKLKKLKVLDKENRNRFYVRKSTSYKTSNVDANNNVKQEKISANQLETPSLYVSRIIQNCQAQYKVNKLPNKLTREETFKQMRSLNKDWKKLADSQAAGMKKQIVEKLLNCPEQAPTVGSCGPGKFGIKPGFCAKSAMQCSNNMRECSEQAQNFVNKFTQSRTVHATNYKNQIKKHKADLTRVFQTALKRFEADGAMLGKAFGEVFSSPGDIGYELQGDGLLKGLPAELELQDPEAYAKMFRDNVEKLKDTVRSHSEKVLENVQQHIADTTSNYETVASKAADYGKECESSHKKFDAQMKQQMAKADEEKRLLGEKISSACRIFGAAQEGNLPHCGDKLSSLMDVAENVGGGFVKKAREARDNCIRTDSTQSGGNAEQLEKKAYRICSTPKDEVKTMCEAFKECNDNRDHTFYDEKEKVTKFVKGKCKDLEREVRIEDIVAKVEKPKSIASSMPAECISQNNSNPNNPKDNSITEIMRAVGSIIAPPEKAKVQ
ncbi:MAG TPA: hypothetical protein VNJ01_09680 [Bacteriovoracaceae bacterium]|nr:hypothetical protein [Bacteriovoracaceae bacterium]